jgi:hypothetical protein
MMGELGAGSRIRISSIALVASLAMVAAYAPTAVSAQQEDPYACGRLIESPEGDAPNSAAGGGGGNVDNLDIIAGGVTADEESSFTVAVGVKDLSMRFPSNATSVNWYFQWSYQDVNYFARATIQATAPTSPTFAFGTYVAPRYTAIGPTTGEFKVGKEGTVEIVVPFEGVGAPPAGDQLMNVYAVTFVGQGVPGAVSSLSQIDRGPKEADTYGESYSVGECEPGGGGDSLDSPQPGLKFRTNTPKRNSKVRATASLKICSDTHVGTVIQLQRRVSGSFKTIASRPLNDRCKARFQVVTRFRSAVFRSRWQKQDDDHRTAASKSVRVRTRS